jgi:lipopolysaccharide export system permease protein
MIRILDRYLLREFLHYLVMGTLLFVGLFVVVDLFEKIDTFVDNSARADDVALYYLYGIPYVLVLTTPIAMLLASLLTLGQVTRAGELGAMLSAGISFFRVLVPLLVFAIVVSAASFALGEWVMPDASVRKDEIYRNQIRGGLPAAAAGKRDVTYMGRGDRLFYIQRVDPRRGVLRDVVVQQFDPERRLVFRLDAREAVWENGFWVFRDGYVRAGMPARELAVRFGSFWMSDIPERVQDFMRAEPDPMSMGRSGLADYIQRLRESRARTQKYEVEYHLKLAFPLVNVIIVFLGTSLSARIRRSGLALGFGLSAFIGFAYFAFVRTGQAIGYNGALPPLAAAWLGNLVFLGIGAAFQVRANR